jgi:pyridoxine 5-phosphate synthase
MVRLSVNVNKVATLRNSRGGHEPDMAQAVETCLAAGAPGITVHPRADERHIRPDDVRTIAALLASRRDSVEFNIEGDPRPDLIDMVLEVRPHQCTLVPVVPGEVTSQAGWGSDSSEQLRPVVARLHERGIRVSLFVDADEAAVAWAAEVGADRIELYTEPYARAFERGPERAAESFARFSAAAERAAQLGLGVNAGHDLDLENLGLFRTLPHLDEVSIGHALISRALYRGLGSVVREYLAALEGEPSRAS